MEKTLIEEAIVQILQNMRSMSENLSQINRSLYLLQSRGIEIRLPVPEPLKEPVSKLQEGTFLEYQDQENVWKTRRFKAKSKA